MREFIDVELRPYHIDQIKKLYDQRFLHKFHVHSRKPGELCIGDKVRGYVEGDQLHLFFHRGRQLTIPVPPK